MDNAAFEEPVWELRRILSDLVLDTPFASPVNIKDYNGNTVGHMEITD